MKKNVGGSISGVFYEMTHVTSEWITIFILFYFFYKENLLN